MPDWCGRFSEVHEGEFQQPAAADGDMVAHALVDAPACADSRFRCSRTTRARPLAQTHGGKLQHSCLKASLPVADRHGFVCRLGSDSSLAANALLSAVAYHMARASQTSVAVCVG